MNKCGNCGSEFDNQTFHSCSSNKEVEELKREVELLKKALRKINLEAKDNRIGAIAYDALNPDKQWEPSTEGEINET